MGILNKTQTNTPTMRTFALLAIAGVAASVKVFGPEAGEGKQNDAANEGKGGRDMPSDEEWQEFREVCTWIGENIDHAAIEAGDYDAAWESIREKAEEHGVTQEEAGEIVMGCHLANEAGAFDHEHPPKEPTEEEWEEFVEACTWLHDNIDHDAMKNEDYDAAWESIREDAEAHGVTKDEAGELVMACIMADEHGLFDDEEDDAPEGEKPEGEKPAEGDFAQEGDDEADDEESGDEKPAGEGKGDDSASDDDDSASDDDDSDSDDDDFDSDSGDEWEKDSQDGEGKQGGKGGEGKQGGKDDDDEEEADEAKADEAEFAQKKGQRGGEDGEKDDEGSDSDDDDSDSDDGDSDSDDDFEKDGEKDGEDKPEGEGEGKPEGEGEGKPEGEGEGKPEG